jgi:hypothetical protein
MEGYRRPPIARLEFLAADGTVIPYGERWWDTPSADLPYSVTAHPERFAPLLEVARALEKAIPSAHRAGGDGIPLSVEPTTFPGVIVWVGGRDFPFPTCGCDACDEDVEQLAEQMEELVEAVVEGRWTGDADAFAYWGDWGRRGGGTNPRGRA